MRLVSITLDNVRRFARPVRIDGIGPGLNVLTAPNESGKSTLFDALRALFFAPYRSSSKDVRALRPLAGGAPEVAAEVETGQGCFRIVKRWLSKPRAEVWQGDRLVAQADEAEAWIARLTLAGGDGGPAGLLWVRQGLTALDAAEGREARRDLMSSVAGEVETLTGGRRMDRALAEARADLANLMTQRGARRDGPLDRAERAVEALEAREADLADKAAALGVALTRRREVLRDLADLTDPQARMAREARLAEATTAHDAATRHAEALAQAEALATAARQERDRARDRLSYLITTRDDLGRARLRQTEAAAHRETAEAALAEAETALAARQTARDSARDARTKAETALRASLRDEAARSAGNRRAELTTRLAEAEGLARHLAVARKAAVGPDAKAIAALDAAQHEVAMLAALRSRRAPHLSVSYASDAAPRVMADGAALVHGATLSVLAETVLDLPGIGRLTVHPGGGTDEAERLADAEARLAALLAELGCATANAAREAATRRAEAETQARDLAARLKGIARDGIEALRAELATLPDPVAAEPALPAPAEAQAAADRAAQALAEAETALDTARRLAEATRQADALAEVEKAAADQQATAAATALAAMGDTAEIEATLRTALDRGETRLTEAEAARAALAANAPDLAATEAALARARSVRQGAEDDLRARSADRAALDAEIALRAGAGVEEELADVRLQIDPARAARDAARFEVEVLQELIGALEAARDSARDRYFEPVMAELKPMLRLLWPEAEMTFDGDSLLPSALIRAGQAEEVAILSGGTREQIALLARLAFARLLARGGRPAPVILDDALVFTDDERIERMFDALHAQAQDLQIIVLSCRNRAFRDLGGRKLTFRPMTEAVAAK